MRTDTYDPELWQLVPKKVTETMVNEAEQTGRSNYHGNASWDEFDFVEVWDAMLASAPTPPASAQSEALYTMDQVRDYADTFHQSRLIVEQAALDDLSTLVRRLVRELRKASPSNDLSQKALDYLERAGLKPNVLRESAQSVEPVYQYRMRRGAWEEDNWHDTYYEDYMRAQGESHIESRILYTAPSAAPAQPVTNRDHVERAIAFHHLELLANGPVVAMQKTLSEFSAAPAQSVVWTARWHGSNPERGWSIYAGRDCIAYIGGDEGMSEAISEIVAAHNKCFDCDGGPCVMNCSGRASRISDATKGGEANPDAQSEAKPVAWLSSFIHRHPDPHWRRIYTAHTSEKRARDYVSDLIDPKVEPLYPTPPSAAYVRDAVIDEALQVAARWYGNGSGIYHSLADLKSKKGA